ncbi:hypothetical protein [Pacificibacter maritimus]|nr:hypothetical protein [Pacificibacter maritimus]
MAFLFARFGARVIMTVLVPIIETSRMDPVLTSTIVSTALICGLTFWIMSLIQKRTMDVLVAAHFAAVSILLMIGYMYGLSLGALAPRSVFAVLIVQIAIGILLALWSDKRWKRDAQALDA